MAGSEQSLTPLLPAAGAGNLRQTLIKEGKKEKMVKALLKNKMRIWCGDHYATGEIILPNWSLYQDNRKLRQGNK